MDLRVVYLDDQPSDEGSVPLQRIVARMPASYRSIIGCTGIVAASWTLSPDTFTEADLALCGGGPAG